MRREVYDSTGMHLLRTEDAEPVCGQDFCDTCGECLACYGADPCYGYGEHRWAVYDAKRA